MNLTTTPMILTNDRKWRKGLNARITSPTVKQTWTYQNRTLKKILVSSPHQPTPSGSIISVHAPSLHSSKERPMIFSTAKSLMLSHQKVKLDQLQRNTAIRICKVHPKPLYRFICIASTSSGKIQQPGTYDRRSFPS